MERIHFLKYKYFILELRCDFRFLFCFLLVFLHIYFKLFTCMCLVSMHVYIRVCKYPRNPEEGVWYPRHAVIGRCELPTWAVDNEPQYPWRRGNSCNLWGVYGTSQVYFFFFLHKLSFFCLSISLPNYWFNYFLSILPSTYPSIFPPTHDPNIYIFFLLF